MDGIAQPRALDPEDPLPSTVRPPENRRQRTTQFVRKQSQKSSFPTFTVAPLRFPAPAFGDVTTPARRR